MTSVHRQKSPDEEAQDDKHEGNSEADHGGSCNPVWNVLWIAPKIGGNTLCEKDTNGYGDREGGEGLAPVRPDRTRGDKKN